MHNRSSRARRSVTTQAHHRRLQIESLEERSLLASAALPTPFAAALVDDAYEQNDTRSTARNLGTLTSSRNIPNLVQGDANDWYRFTTSTTGASSSNVSIAFQHAQGDLDLELYNASGTRLRTSQSIASSETVSLGGLAAGTYYVRVYGYRGATNPNYSLAVNLGSAIVADDAYENNDTLATATNLGTLTANTSRSNLRLADSADWFRFTTSSTGTISSSASISFQNTQGNLALQLYNSSGTLLATANGTGNSESVSLNGRAAGTYYARIYSAAGATNPNYSFQIVTPTVVTAPTSGAFDIQIVYSGFTASQRTIFEQAAARWESIIVGDLPNATYNGVIVDDLLINASATAIDGVGGTLGQAGYDRARTSGTQLPYHGSMEFDSADLASMEANGSLLNVIVHEIGHVLGIGTLWQSKGLLTGAGTSNPLFMGAQAVSAYNAIFGTSAVGVPVENSGGSGTRDAHWRESTFNNEIMTGYINSGSNPISRITIASLADLGYSVNMTAANAYTRPSGTAGLLAGSGSTGSANLLSSESSSSSAEAIFGSRQGFVGCLCRSCSGAPAPTAQAARTASSAIPVEALWLSAQPRQSAVPMSNPSRDAATSETQTAGWSANLDLLFAGESDLNCLAPG
jgi:hypothetical protein